MATEGSLRQAISTHKESFELQNDVTNAYDLDHRKTIPLTRMDHPFWLHYRTLEPFIHHNLAALDAPLLDLGCGSKPYRSLYPPGEVVGADVFDGSAVDVKLEVGKPLPFKDNYFANVFCSQVFEHVYDVDLLLSEAFRVTRSGGKLVLTVPFVWDLHEEPNDYLRFTRYWLDRRLRDIGYSSIEITPQGGDIAMIGQSILLIITRRRPLPKLLVRLFNKCFDFLDRKYPTNNFPLNYGVTALK